MAVFISLDHMLGQIVIGGSYQASFDAVANLDDRRGSSESG